MKLKRKTIQPSELEESVEEDDEEFDGEGETEVKDEPVNEDGLYDDDFMDDYGEAMTEPPMQKHSDLLKSLTNFDPYIKDCFNNWLGLSWNEKEQEFSPNPDIKPIMTIKGAAWCIGLLKTYTRSNNIITNISHQEYINLINDHIDAIWLNLGTRNDLGIIEEGDLIRVANELEHSACLILMGAGEGKYNQFLGTTYSHHTTGAESQKEIPQVMMVKPNSNPLQRLRELLKGK